MTPVTTVFDNRRYNEFNCAFSGRSKIIQFHKFIYAARATAEQNNRKILRSGGNSGKHIDVEREKAHILYGKDEIFVGNEFSLVFRSKS